MTPKSHVCELEIWKHLNPPMVLMIKLKPRRRKNISFKFVQAAFSLKAFARYFSQNYYHLKCECRSSPPEVLLIKGVLKICSKFTVEHPYRSSISIKLHCNFIGIALQHGCSPVNQLHIFRTPFPKSTSGKAASFCQQLAGTQA